MRARARTHDIARRKYSNRPIIIWRQRESVNSEFFPADINCSQIASSARGDLNWFRINCIAWEGEEYSHGNVRSVLPRARVVNQLHTHHVPLRIALRVWHTCQIIFPARSRRGNFAISSDSSGASYCSFSSSRFHGSHFTGITSGRVNMGGLCSNLIPVINIFIISHQYDAS